MTLRALLRLAWREGHASWRRPLLLVAAIATGTAALVAINTFTANLRTAVSGEARSLLGADLAFASRTAPTESLGRLADSLACAGAAPCEARATVTTFGAMGYAPSRTGVRLVRVTAVEGGWPFFGRISTSPAGAWPELQSARVALVDPAFLTALGASIGDTLAHGALRVPIIGTVDHVPGDVGFATAFGPRVFIPGTHWCRKRGCSASAPARSTTLTSACRPAQRSRPWVRWGQCVSALQEVAALITISPITLNTMTSAGPADSLQPALGYRFTRPALLDEALTHKSYVNEQRRGPAVHNERLEFLGDAVLSLLLSEQLSHSLPGSSEGVLSKLKARLVSEPVLCAIARQLQIGQWFRLGRGEERSKGREKDSLLADTLEAVIAAVYLDGGLDAGRAVVAKLSPRERRLRLRRCSD